MEYEIKKAATMSSDGVHSLAGVLYIPKGEVKGLFHIIHGMTEHIARYDYLMSELAKKGYVAFGYDNLGHGYTASSDDELGFIADENGWEYLIDDTFLFEQKVMELYPDKRLTVMGHSMGSFIARLAALKYGENYENLIICGTGGPNPVATFGILVASIIEKIKGKKHRSALLEKIAFGAYNSRFEKTSPYSWLTKDKEVIERYEADKFCNFSFTVSAMKDLIMLTSLANSKTWFYEIRRDLPMLIISGKDDPVGNYGKGVRAVYDKLKENRVRNVILKLYDDCRHEILNDSCRDEVIEHIMSFIGE